MFVFEAAAAAFFSRSVGGSPPCAPAAAKPIADATMRAMFRTLRPYLIAVVCSWLALLLTATIYSREHPSFHWVWMAAFPAFLLETLFYLSSVFENTRSWFTALPRTSVRAGLLWVSAILPYLVFALGAGTYEIRLFCLLLFLTAVLVFWHVVVPRRPVYDLGFLVVAAAPFVSRV